MRHNSHRLLTALAVACGASYALAVDFIDLPCDAREPYEAPRDPRLEGLFAKNALEVSKCGEGGAWTAAYGRQDAKKAFGAGHNESLFWGSYRPHVYFGMKTREAPDSVVTGIMWKRKGDDGVKHECRESDKLKKYGWNKHDGRTYGEQHIIDKAQWVTLTTSFVKPQILHKSTAVNPTENTPSTVWHQKIEVAPYGESHHALVEQNKGPLELFFYIGTDCDGSAVDEECPEYVQIGGKAPETASGRTVLDLGNGQRVEIRTEGEVRYKCVDDVATIEEQAVKWDDDADGVKDTRCRVGLFKVTGVSTVIASLVEGGEADDNNDADVEEWFKKGEALFKAKFEAAFPKKLEEQQRLTAEYAISNLIGGAGWWHGRVPISDPTGTKHTDPITLYSFVPSRSFFPRGFLWDEGFHLKAVLHFDKALAAESLASWMLTMRGHSDPVICPGGWIPREQAIGRAAQSRVPKEFLPQNPMVANPPTLLSLVTSDILTKTRDFKAAFGERCKATDGLAVGCAEALFDQKELAASLLPYFQAWSVWLVDSQEANKAAYFETGLEPIAEEDMDKPLLQEGLYTWRGRDPSDRRLVPMTLSSGLDDYPRSYWPSHHEAHLDLACWVASSQNALAEIVESQGDPSATAFDIIGNKYRKKAYSAVQAILMYHYDTSKNLFADRGLVSQRIVREGTVSDGSPIGPSITVRRDISIRCGNSEGGTADSGIPIDDVAAMQQTQKWNADPKIRPKMRVKITKTLRFKKNNVIIWQGTRATVNKIEVPNKKNMIEVTSDTGVTFNVRFEEVRPLLSTKEYGDYCPEGYPKFLYPLGDGKGGLQMRSKIVSVEAPTPGLVTEHRGYVSYLPLFLHLLPYTDHAEFVDSIISALQDDSIFSDHGLRSLSSDSQIYMIENAPGDAPYWRGALWMNMNYLALEGLDYYAKQGSAIAAQTRDSLALRISATVVNSYNKTGYLFEHYDDINGLGQRSHPFSGWSALIVNILAGKY